MNKLVLYIALIIGLSITLQKGTAQLIYFSDSFGKLFTVDISSGTCDVTLLGQMEFNNSSFVPTDIAFHPNGKFYATEGQGLYEINVATLTASYIGAHNAPASDFINALVCDSDGVLYGADSRLYSININNGNVTNLGNLPCESAGDLAFNNNDLYLACQANNLLKIDINNTASSQIVGTMNANSLFFGIVTFATECSDVQTFGTAGNGLYQIDVSNAASSFVCNLSGANEVYGAAMETDFIASDCEFVVDLDGDNSSLALIYDYFADSLCGNFSSPIADTDFYVIAEGIVDSMVLDISAGLLDGNSEQLQILSNPDNLNIIGSGTSHITAVSTGNVQLIDLVHVVEGAVYVNTAMPYSPGVREITVQIFAQDDNQSEIATAFITLMSGIPFSIDLGMDSTLCEGENLILDAFYDGAMTYEWNDGSMNATLNASTSGLYTVTVTDDCGITATDDVILTFVPPVDILDLGPDLILCPGESVVLDATLIDGVDYEWEDGSVDPVITVTETGYYGVSVTASCGIQTGDVFIEFQEIPTISVLPNDTLGCQGETITFDATLPDALAYSWQDGSTEPVLTVSESGYYEVVVTMQCGEYTDDVLVTYNDYDLFVDLGPDTTFCFGDSLVINAESPFAFSYLWQDGTTNVDFVVNATGNYAVTISDGCTSVSDQVFLRMTSCCNVFVPNVFSPNDDGANDYFKTFSNCEFPVYNFRVFNRWGGEVFHSNEQSRGWDGRYLGEEGQQGVYVWILEYNDGLEDQVLAGDVTLVR